MGRPNNDHRTALNGILWILRGAPWRDLPERYGAWETVAGRFYRWRQSGLSKKQKGSRNRERARRNLVRQHEDVANRRKNWFWKLAHEVTELFDVLCFETLSIKGMQRLWGRKVCDLALGEFLQILECVAAKKNKQIVFVDRWYPSTKTCYNCKHVVYCGKRSSSWL